MRVQVRRVHQLVAVLAAGVIGAGAAEAASLPSAQAAPGSSPTVVVPGPAQVELRAVVPISGHTTPGTVVKVLFRRRGTVTYVLRRTLTADGSGRFSTFFVPVDDYVYYVSAPGYTSPMYRTQIAPATREDGIVELGRGSVYPLAGTAIPNSTVQLRFHPMFGSSGPDVLRSVTVDRNGNWSRPYVVAANYWITPRGSANAVAGRGLGVLVAR